MPAIIVVIVVVIVVIWMYSLESNKETLRERMGDGLDNMLHDGADAIGDTVREMVEPKDKKETRLAKEMLAQKIHNIITTDIFSYKYQNYLFSVDDKFKKVLDQFEITESDWSNEISIKFFYLRVIYALSRESRNEDKRKSPEQREYIITNWGKEDGTLGEYWEVLTNALNFYNIPVDEWIQYGDAVLDIYDLYEDEWLKKCAKLIE